SFVRIAGGAALALLAGLGFVLVGARLNQGNIQVTPNGAGSDNNNVAQGTGEATSTPEPQPTDTPVPANTPTQKPGEPSPTTGSEPPTATTEPAPPPTNTTVPAQPVPVIKVSEITPNDSFYHVSKNFFDPSPSADGWQLEFKGLVDNPYALTYA